MEDVAGYRVLRTAGHGDRAALLVGFDDGETVVVKVTRRDDGAVPREVEALRRSAGDHVVGLRDVESDARQVALVLDRLSRGTLAELLDRRASLDPGEAVTILAPLATTIARLHAAGVAHGAVSPATVCFDDDGSPTLVGFGSAELFTPGAPEVVLDGIGGVAADRQALRVLVESVLTRVGGVAGQRLDVSEASPAGLAAALLDWATPAPVRFDADAMEAVVLRPTAIAAETGADESTSPGLPPWVTMVVPDTVLERIEEPVAKISAIWRGWSTRRRRLVLGGAAGVVATLVLGAALPAPVPSAATGSTSPVPAVTASGETAVDPELPDDPVAAADILLDARAQCFRELSLLCLDAVVQPSSAAATHDLALMRELQAGGEYPGAAALPGEPVLVERLGDTALLDLPAGSSPASVLILRTTEGWRLRQYFDAVPRPDGAPEPDATPGRV